MTHAQTSAAIIAGGLARRFGGVDKSRLVVRGRPIIVRQVGVLQQVAHEIFVVGGAPDRFADLSLVVREDAMPGMGVAGGIYTALECAAHEHVITIGSDLPFLSAALLRHLVAASADADGAWVVTPAGAEPLIACYRRSARTRVRALLDGGVRAARSLSDVLDMRAIGPEDLSRFGDPAELLTNLNSPDDLARVQ